MRKVSKIMLILVAIVAVLVSLNSSVYATEIQNVVTITDSGSNQNATANPINAVGNSTNDTNETNGINDTTQNIVIENEVPEEDIPETGKEDTALLVLIAVVAISSIYTYMKVRKYNI